MNNILSFFKDRHGKWAVVQFPNTLLLTWLMLIVIGVFVHDNSLKTSVDQLKNTVLFAWAYLEFAKGISYFRRVLGGVIMIMIVIGFFVK
ncbi:MAG: hypothetical protein WC505_08215 [Patescibacteria group bacterium]